MNRLDQMMRELENRTPQPTTKKPRILTRAEVIAWETRRQNEIIYLTNQCELTHWEEIKLLKSMGLQQYINENK